MSSTAVQIKTVKVDGDIEVFYREAGVASAPTVLLLHGFPTSSFQYRNLIPRLAPRYHVLAPDLPGFGFTVVPESREYKYTFDSFAKTIGAFLDALKVSKFAVYIFDYGAPTGLRLALERPDSITAIISQNGNAYKEGLGEVWGSIEKYWKEPTSENREALRWLVSLDATKWQYVTGEPNPEAVPPETYHLDFALLSRPGNADIQLDLFLNYETNVALYPAFQQYFRDRKPPVLAVWGKNDQLFIAAGAEAYKKDNPNAIVRLIDGGHFALESHLEEVSAEVMAFLRRHGI